jgi:hypothetical protein
MSAPTQEQVRAAIAAEIRDLRVNGPITVGHYAQMDPEDRWDRGAACICRAILGALGAEIGEAAS